MEHLECIHSFVVALSTLSHSPQPCDIFWHLTQTIWHCSWHHTDVGRLSDSHEAVSLFHQCHAVWGCSCRNWEPHESPQYPHHGPRVATPPNQQFIRRFIRVIAERLGKFVPSWHQCPHCNRCILFFTTFTILKMGLHGQLCPPFRRLPSTSDKINRAFTRQTYDLDI